MRCIRSILRKDNYRLFSQNKQTACTNIENIHISVYMERNGKNYRKLLKVFSLFLFLFCPLRE